MAMINCPECNSQMSDNAETCAQCGHILEKPSRGFIGTGFKWMFILFNIFMFGLMYMSMGNTEESNNIVQFAAGMGISMLIAMWVMGNVILGGITYLTRVKQ
ncbi:MAG: Seryl-tRNA synthetase, class IIa [uncultured Sulfurovum sp.]|uniref:Seryl-tRNA synthetase, class IIa n=1 Tax=uncultured Sulfurovum sp. TaxID=269237 RepID=A0A6S6TY83_9BACT|nr:MAG: Seryl-tRNA synthetase, class IIa [uncultured Sulfurovum sp.]